MRIRKEDGKPYLRAHCSEEIKEAFGRTCEKAKLSEKDALLMLAQRFIENPAEFTETKLKSGDILPPGSEGGIPVSGEARAEFIADRVAHLVRKLLSEPSDRATSGEPQASAVKARRRRSKGS